MYVDKRLAGIQAVQTLSRLNQAHPGKDTTYVLDFVNDGAEVLEAFKTYYDTARLESTTDPNLVFDLRAKLDAQGHYDDNEVERVVRVEFDPNAKQSELVAALEPVADRLLKRYAAFREALKSAQMRQDEAAAKSAQDELDALQLFKGDLGAFIRLYTLLSQIFDYGNTAVEKRAILYKRLLPLLEFDRERLTVDLSKMVLTHHAVKNKGKQVMDLGGDASPLPPIDSSGAGQVRERQKAYLAEIIAKLNDLFTGELTDDDKLVCVNNVLKDRLLESAVLRHGPKDLTHSRRARASAPRLSTRASKSTHTPRSP